MSIEQRLLELADETLRDARWKTEIRKIAEEVRMIEARIQRLEEAGDALFELCDASPIQFGLVDQIPQRLKAWEESKEAKP